MSIECSMVMCSCILQTKNRETFPSGSDCNHAHVGLAELFGNHRRSERKKNTAPFTCSPHINHAICVHMHLTAFVPCVSCV